MECRFPGVSFRNWTGVNFDHGAVANRWRVKNDNNPAVVSAECAEVGQRRHWEAENVTCENKYFDFDAIGDGSSKTIEKCCRDRQMLLGTIFNASVYYIIHLVKLSIKIISLDQSYRLLIRLASVSDWSYGLERSTWHLVVWQLKDFHDLYLRSASLFYAIVFVYTFGNRWDASLCWGTSTR